MYDTREQKLTKVLWRTWGFYPNITQYQASSTRVRKSGSVYSWRGPKAVKDDLGWIPPHDFILKQFKAQFMTSILDINYSINPDGSYRVYHQDGFYLQDWFPLADVSTTLDPGKAQRAMDLAIAKAYEDLNSPDCPGLTWIAESIESAHMIKNLCTQAFRLCRDYKARKRLISKIRDTKKKAKQLSDLWLQFRYGIMPIVYQTEDIIKLMSGPKKELKVVTGFIETDEDLSLSEILYVGNFHGTTWTVRHTKKLTFRGAAKLYPQSQADPHPFGFGAFDSVLTAWELLPFSFVVDWFVNVGTWLASWRPGNASIRYQSNTLVASVIEEYEVVDVRYNIRNAAGLNGQAVENVKHSGKYRGTSSQVVRNTVVANTLLPRFEVESLSAVRTIDAIALLIGQLFRLLK